MVTHVSHPPLRSTTQENSMYTFEAQIKVASPSGTTLLVKTRIQAQDPYRAKLLLEQQ